MCWSTKEVSHYTMLQIGHAAIYVQQLNIILYVDSGQPWYRCTHLWSHDAFYGCCFQFDGLFLTVGPGWYLGWLHSECCGGLSGVCVEDVPEWVAYWMKHLSFCSIVIHSYLVEVFLEAWFAGVEVKRKMITKGSGKSWGIYSFPLVKMECITANLLIRHQMNPAAYMAANCRHFQSSSNSHHVAPMLCVCFQW